MKTLLMIPLILILFQGCENNGTEIGDPTVTQSELNLQLSGFTATALLDFFLPKAFATVARVDMCIHQIRFKADSSSDTPGENANIEVGLAQLNSSGTDLGNIMVASGDYRRIDIMLKDECTNNRSIEIQNDNGTFVGLNPLTLRFIGNITIDDDSNLLILNIVPFINFFDTVTTDNELTSGVTNIDGNF